MNTIKRLIAAFLCVTVLFGAMPAHAAESVGSPTSKTFTTTNTEYLNPERGWMLFSSLYLNTMTSSEANTTYSNGFRLIFARINLSAYRTTATLPSSFLTSLTTGFGYLRSAGLKAVLRPVYNYDSSGADATLAIGQGHLAQMSAIFKANADVIAYVQAGMIGAWGEWHSSVTMCPGTSTTASCRLAMIQSLLNAFDPRTIIQVRYPKYVMAWYPTALGASTRFSGNAQSRVAHNNDCFMSNDTDVGTYQSSNISLSNPERARVATDTNYTPFGGETCSGFTPQRLGCDSGSGIMLDGPRYHLTYLNRYFYQGFMDSWTSGGCFDEVARSIGYRFQLDGITHQSTATAGQSITATVTLRNKGWSRIFSARRLNLVLRHSGGSTIACIGDQDLRELAPQASSSTTMKVRCTIPASATAGTYDAYLAIPDVWPGTASNPKYSVRPANPDSGGDGQSWDAANGRFKVGTTLVVS